MKGLAWFAFGYYLICGILAWVFEMNTGYRVFSMSGWLCSAILMWGVIKNA